jgi:probable F420-dependent oxidoreductase
MSAIKVGVQLLPQHTSFAEYQHAWFRLDELGVDSLWTWDHFFPLSFRRFGRLLHRFGPPTGASFEGWTLLAALGVQATRAQVGCLAFSIGYRNPALLSAMATTLDHATGGRLILGVGAGWHRRDYDEYGYRFGTAGERLAALERGVEIIKARWQTDNPRPLRGAVPLLIGGDGERVTLRIVTQHADVWNGFGPPDAWSRRNRVLDERCGRVGRDSRAIERSAYIGSRDLDHLDEYRAAGTTHLIFGLGVPFSQKSIDRLLEWRARHTEACPVPQLSAHAVPAALDGLTTAFRARLRTWPVDRSPMTDSSRYMGLRPDLTVRRLTPREREVALLVADGLKDAAIARRLGLTPSTVASYVGRIQRRLDLAGRADITAWVAARRLPGNPEARLRRVGVREPT